jgi:hypothetical protein
MATATKSRPRLSDEERKARIDELSAQLDTALDSLSDEKHWVTLLETVATFGSQYSWGNQLLIADQCAARGFAPTMTRAFGFWKQHGRMVTKGQKGLKIWAPCRHRPTEGEIVKLSEAGKKVSYDADGRPSAVLHGWKVEHTFDVSQTEGDPIDVPEPKVREVRGRYTGPLPEVLDGEDPTGALGDVVRLIEAEGYRYCRGQILSGAQGETIPSVKSVAVASHLSDAQVVATSVHELAHIRCEHVTGGYDYISHQGRAETEAESVAYIVCGALGLDTGAYSAPYINGWAEGDKKVITETTRRVVAVAQGILADLESRLG